MTARLPIVQYWDSGEPPTYLAERIATFRDLNPEMDHLLFDERSAGEFIAERIGEREATAFRACAVPTMQSDFFRYCAVGVLGGVYVDAGFSCRAPLWPLLEGIAGGRLFSRGYVFSGILMFAAPGHPLPRLALEAITANVERRSGELVQMVTGPWILSGLSLLHELGSRGAMRRRVAEQGIGRLFGPLCRRALADAPTAVGHDRIAASAEGLLAAAGDYDRLAEAFRGVRVTPYSMVRDWLPEPEAPLPYKSSDQYWINWQKRRSIFR